MLYALVSAGEGVAIKVEVGLEARRRGIEHVDVGQQTAGEHLVERAADADEIESLVHAACFSF